MRINFNYKILFCIITLTGKWAYGQETQSLISTGANGGEIKIPNVIPPSPESSFKTDFGNIPINEYRGMPSLRIPIHTFSNGEIEQKIDLVYSKLGVKVNDISDIVGVSWILDTGGIINRTIYDLPDESGERFIISNINSLNISNIQEGTSEAEFISAKVKNENIDNEVDIFNFSVGNYSGSFYLDSNFQPVILEDGAGVKIQSVGNFAITHEFVLTAPDGIKYYFGGSNFVDATFIKNNPAFGGITSFYLYKVEAGNNTMEYTYYTDNSKLQALSEFQSQSYGFQSSFPAYQPNNSCSVPPPTSNVSKINTLNIQNPKKIKSIKFNNQEILFNYTSVNNQEYGKLIGIQVYNHQVLKKQINFSYIDKLQNSQNQRFFLEKVQSFAFNNNILNLAGEYKLEYDDPLDIPARLSKSIDVLGYFNGKYANTTLVPNLVLLGGSYDNPALADRRANFQFAKKGTLKSITYPTKGKTIFEYESQGIKEAVYNQIYGSVTTEGGSNVNSDFKTLNGSELYIKPSDSSGLSPVNIQITLSMINPTAIPALQGKIRFKIINTSTQEEILVKNLFLPKNEGYLNHEFVFNANKNINYKFFIEIAGSYQDFTSDFAVRYQTGIKRNEGVGLRLKKQYDVNEQGNITNIKRIYYTDIKNYDNLEILSENPYTPGAFTTTKYTQFVADQQGPTGSSGCFSNGDSFFNYEKLIISEPITSNEFELVPSYSLDNFPTVSISYGGEHFEKGGEQKEFIHENENALMTIRNPNEGLPAYVGMVGELQGITQNVIQKIQRKRSYNHYNGNITDVFVFSRGTDNNLYLKKKTQNVYGRIEGNSIYNLLGNEIYQATAYPSGTVSGAALFNMWFGFTKVSTFFNPLQQIKTTDYFENVPIDVTDDTNYKKLVTNVHYNYYNIEKQLTKQTLTTPDNSITETNYQYAHEKNNQLLISKNMIGIPLETTVTQTVGGVTKTLGKTETVYPASLPTPQAGNLVLPLSQKSYDKLSGTSSTDVTYDRYDEKGNILQYTTKDGIPVALVWGYNKTQPIAKVEGITYDQLTSSVPVSGIVTASDNDAADPAQENLLLDALNSFRKQSALSGKLISTYTYDPLIGVTSITPPSGVRQTYTYDPANRLKETGVRGKNSAGSYINKKMSENKYNYKP